MSPPRERPVLFSAPMVRAILADRKTVTRRICRVQPEPWNRHHAEGGCHVSDWRPAPCDDGTWDLVSTHAASDVPGFGHCPYGGPGDRLWVRETWRTEEFESGLDGIRYAADDTFRPIEDTAEAAEAWVAAHAGQRGCKASWRPSIFMRPWMSRLLLEVVSVRVERLHAITEEDARAEGFPLPGPQPTRLRVTHMDGRVETSKAVTVFCSALHNFCALWDAINGKRAAWSSNPWVWRIEFRRASR